MSVVELEARLSAEIIERGPLRGTDSIETIPEIYNRICAIYMLLNGNREQAERFLDGAQAEAGG